MKNLLTLDEAVAVVLFKQKDKTATFKIIADIIEKKNLFPERKGGITLEEQIKLRTTVSAYYKVYFEYIKPNQIKLK